MGRIGVQLVAAVRLGALEDDQQHDEHARIDKVADALHAESQHHLRSTIACKSMAWLVQVD